MHIQMSSHPRPCTSTHIPHAPRSLLEVAFTLQDGTPASVRASLPPTFPQDPPSLSATPALQHPWINPDGKLEPPSLASWGRGGARLAAVVQQVVAELAAKARASPSAHTTYAVPATPNPISPTLPDLPRSFPLLDSLSNEQLLEALTQPSKFEELERRVAAELHLEQASGRMLLPIKIQEGMGCCTGTAHGVGSV